MILTVQTPPQIQQRHAVHMKVMTAAWTARKGGIQGSKKQDNHPDTEGDGHAAERGGNPVCNPHQRHIEDDGGKEVFSAPADQIHGLFEGYRIDLIGQRANGRIRYRLVIKDSGASR